MGDTKFEKDEFFYVNLSNPVNASIGDGLGLFTILNDDVRIFIDNVSAAETNSGASDFVFTVAFSEYYFQKIGSFETRYYFGHLWTFDSKHAGGRWPS